MQSFLCLLCLVFVKMAKGQVQPSSFTFEATSISVNGSSATGHCSNVTTGVSGNGTFSRCNDPTSSVLFDGNIPTLTGLDEDMWASQLLTLQTTDSQLDIYFGFSGTPGFTRVERVEVVMFNCPEWGIRTQLIRVRAGNVGQTPDVIGQFPITDTSCDSLVKLCLAVSTTFPEITLQFFPPPGFNWVHLAEVKFIGDVNAVPTCAQGPITTMPTDTPPTTVATSIAPDSTSASVYTGIPITSSETPSSSPIGITTTDTTTSSNSASISQIVIIVGVIVIVVLVATFAVTPILILVCLWRKQQKQEKARLDSTRTTAGPGTLQKETDMELTGQGAYEAIDEMETMVRKGKATADWCDTGGSVYEDPDCLSISKSKGNISATYEDTLRCVETGEVAEEPKYNTLREHEQPSKVGSDVYSQLNHSENPRVASEEGSPMPMYFTLCEPGCECIEMRKKPAPPNKSPALTILKGKHPHTMHRESSPKTGAPTRSGVNAGVTSEDTSAKLEVTQEEGVKEIVYTEPGSIAPKPGESFYEQIYSESALTPASFNEGSRPSEVSGSDNLHHYSSIYTVPAVPVNNKPLEVTSKNIKVVKCLGTGNFGSVLLAKTIGLNCKDLKIRDSSETNVKVLVAVKKLKANASVSARTLFEKEYLFMCRLNHPNVVCLLGVCKRDTPFIMMEYMEKGDLNQFLQNHERIVTGDSPGQGEITQPKLISVCAQIAGGMKYLASKNFVHRDLATRNCLVSDKLDVKIADFGMSRNLYDSHYYVIKGQAILPIRWMASECFYGQFSAKTDVWAFGATMWEVFELAKHEPYYEMGDRELVEDACKKQDRTILSCPSSCPDEVYEIMLQCWYHHASERATFEQLQEMLLPV